LTHHTVRLSDKINSLQQRAHKLHQALLDKAFPAHPAKNSLATSPPIPSPVQRIHPLSPKIPLTPTFEDAVQQELPLCLPPTPTRRTPRLILWSLSCGATAMSSETTDCRPSSTLNSSLTSSSSRWLTRSHLTHSTRKMPPLSFLTSTAGVRWFPRRE